MSKAYRDLLIVFRGFDVSAFFQRERSRDWNFLLLHDFARMSLREVIQRIILPKRKKLFFGYSTFAHRQLRYLVEFVLLTARAEEKFIVDNNGHMCRMRLAHFLWHTLKLTIECVLSSIVVFGTYTVVFFLSAMPKMRVGKVQFRNKTIAYLRTDYFASDNTVGGSFSHVEGLRDGLLHHGYTLFFFAHASPGVFDEKQTPFFRIPYTTFHDLPEIPDILYNYKYIWHAVRFLRRKRTEVLYQRHSIFTFAGVVLRMILRVPLFLEYNGSETWVRRHWGGRLFLQHLCFAIESLALKKADKIFVVSAVLKEALLRKGILGHHIVVNPNGVDPKMFHPDVSGQRIRKQYKFSRRIIVGFVGSFGRWHGIELLAQAIKHVVLRSSGDIHFLLVGDGVLRPLVEKIIREDRMEPFVTFSGTVPHRVVPYYLACCDVLVSPHLPNNDGSLFFGSPTKLFEYMGMGKAIVASDLGQIREALTHMRTAYLVRPGSLHDLIHGILRLTSDVALRVRLGRAARADVVKIYTWTRNAYRVIREI